jgi:hypothetical protein
MQAAWKISSPVSSFKVGSDPDTACGGGAWVAEAPWSEGAALRIPPTPRMIRNARSADANAERDTVAQGTTTTGAA